MESLFLFVLFVLFIAPLIHCGKTIAEISEDGSEDWGYVEVRPKAHMFWWLYRSPYRVEDPLKPWPIILWLQGGPGSSGVGIGNFKEMGPLDTSLKKRNSTWLQKADLLFVDNPVGTGYSFVEDTRLFVKSEEEAATDMTTLLQDIFNKNQTLQKSPLYIVAESYGGKLAVTLALSALKAIETGSLKLKLGGVALGDTWISPQDYTFTWGPILKDMSRLDDEGLKRANNVAKKIEEQIENGQFVEATSSWRQLQDVISSDSNGVDFHNFLLDSAASLNLYDLMNGDIRKKLKIIPPHVTWREKSEYVFLNLEGDFMKPRINEVDELLTKGVNVTIYNGQVDLFSSTKGTETWVHKLRWGGLPSFLRERRTPLYCGNNRNETKGFIKSYKNLHFYWILLAGHFVPIDQPCVALNMVGAITQSPASDAHINMNERKVNTIVRVEI